MTKSADYDDVALGLLYACIQKRLSPLYTQKIHLCPWKCLNYIY